MVDAIKTRENGRLASLDKKMIFGKYREVLTESLRKLNDSIHGAIKTSMDAPGPMISKSDTTKAQFGWLADALDKNAGAVAEAITTLNVMKTENRDSIGVGSIFAISQNDGPVRVYALVGGSQPCEIEIDGIKVQFVSPASPLAKEALGKKAGEIFEFRNKEYEIMEVV